MLLVLHTNSGSPKEALNPKKSDTQSCGLYPTFAPIYISNLSRLYHCSSHNHPHNTLIQYYNVADRHPLWHTNRNIALFAFYSWALSFHQHVSKDYLGHCCHIPCMLSIYTFLSDGKFSLLSRSPAYRVRTSHTRFTPPRAINVTYIGIPYQINTSTLMITFSRLSTVVFTLFPAILLNKKHVCPYTLVKVRKLSLSSGVK